MWVWEIHTCYQHVMVKYIWEWVRMRCMPYKWFWNMCFYFEKMCFYLSEWYTFNVFGEKIDGLKGLGSRSLRSVCVFLDLFLLWGVQPFRMILFTSSIGKEKPTICPCILYILWCGRCIKYFTVVVFCKGVQSSEKMVAIFWPFT